MLYRKLITLLFFVSGFGCLNRLSATVTVTVTSADDHTTLTSGELRYAIDAANNATLGPGPYVINFNIPSGGGPVVIMLTATLPNIHTGSITIDGTTQAGYSVGRPVIIIDGSNLPVGTNPRGLTFNNMESGTLEGIYVRFFTEGIALNLCTGCNVINNVSNQNTHTSIVLSNSSSCTVQGNYVNTDIDLTSFATKSEEGIFLTNTSNNSTHSNTIGGTGCGEGNVIMYTRSEGIDNNPSLPAIPGNNISNHITGNTICNNTYDAIELRDIANYNKVAPVIVTAGCTTSGTSEPYDVIELFGSSGPTYSKRNANVFMKSVTADGSGNWSATLDFIPFPFITATATNSAGNTSELSPAKDITPDPFGFTFPTELCENTEITFTNISSTCAGSYTYDWDYGDGSGITSSDTHTYTETGDYVVTLFMHPDIYCKPYAVTHSVHIADCCPRCSELNFSIPTLCLNTEATFVNTSTLCVYSPTYVWNFGDSETDYSSGTHTYTTAGTYTVTLSIQAVGSCKELLIQQTVTVNDCTPPCTDCIGSFAPDPGTYILSAWVKEDGAVPTQLTYTNPQLYVDFLATSDPAGATFGTAAGPFTATGNIIDGWQRVEEKFTIPAGCPFINIRLESASGDCYFDDIRVFPTDGSMKSYVYDPATLRLVAELDERNYATFYEYDEEGKLIRVKKETERGIMTIKENRNSTIKQ